MLSTEHEKTSNTITALPLGCLILIKSVSTGTIRLYRAMAETALWYGHHGPVTGPRVINYKCQKKVVRGALCYAARVRSTIFSDLRVRLLV